MIDLYYWTTPNGHKITIFLEETGLREGRSIQTRVFGYFAEQPDSRHYRSRAEKWRKANRALCQGDQSFVRRAQRRVFAVTDTPQVVEMAVSEQDHVDIARCVARAGEVAEQPAGRVLELVDAAACVDQHQLVARVDEDCYDGRIANERTSLVIARQCELCPGTGSDRHRRNHSLLGRPQRGLRPQDCNSNNHRAADRASRNIRSDRSCAAYAQNAEKVRVPQGLPSRPVVSRH